MCKERHSSFPCRMFSVAREMKQTENPGAEPKVRAKEVQSRQENAMIHSGRSTNDSGCPEMTFSLRKARMGAAALQAGARLGLGTHLL